MPSLRARQLRRTQTEAESRLWFLLRDRRIAHCKFRRQHPIGPYIADFACVAARLIVEADGGQHADSPIDARRTAWLRAAGWEVIRFWNNDPLQQPGAVVERIVQALGAIGGQSPTRRAAPGDLSRSRGRGEGVAPPRRMSRSFTRYENT